MAAKGWIKIIKILVSSHVFEPGNNGHINNITLMELEKFNKGHKTSSVTKIIDGPTTEKCPGLGREASLLRNFAPSVEGSLKYSACETSCCQRYFQHQRK